jgi:TolB protein
VFASNRNSSSPYNFDIWVMSVAGDELKQLTIDPEYDSDPRWSPDGKKISFVSGRDGNFEIYVMNPDGSDQTDLTRSPYADGGAAWSPDARSIVFASQRGSDHEDIFLMDADGRNPRRLTENALRRSRQIATATGKST